MKVVVKVFVRVGVNVFDGVLVNVGVNVQDKVNVCVGVGVMGVRKGNEVHAIVSNAVNTIIVQMGLKRFPLTLLNFVTTKASPS